MRLLRLTAYLHLLLAQWGRTRNSCVFLADLPQIFLRQRTDGSFQYDIKSQVTEYWNGNSSHQFKGWEHKYCVTGASAGSETHPRLLGAIFQVCYITTDKSGWRLLCILLLVAYSLVMSVSFHISICTTWHSSFKMWSSTWSDKSGNFFRIPNRMSLSSMVRSNGLEHTWMRFYSGKSLTSQYWLKRKLENAFNRRQNRWPFQTGHDVIAINCSYILRSNFLSILMRSFFLPP